MESDDYRKNQFSPICKVHSCSSCGKVFILSDPIQTSEASLYINDKEKAPALRVAEKVLFLRLLKNAPAFAEAASRRQADAS